MITRPDGLVLTKREIGALLAFASKDETRPRLSAIHVDPEHGRVFAIDCHRLLLLETEPWGGSEFSIAATHLERAARALGDMMLAPEGDRIVMGSCDRITGAMDPALVVSAPRVTAEPPAIDDVIEDLGSVGAPVETFALDAAYLADVRVLEKLLEGEHAAILLCVPDDPLRPVSVIAESSRQCWLATAVIMPMRHDRDPSRLTCENCHAEFRSPRAHAKYCSHKCRQAAFRRGRSEAHQVVAAPEFGAMSPGGIA